MPRSIQVSEFFSTLKRELRPALFKRIAEGYGAGDFKKDLVAGITVGVVALPLAMAFAIGAGASPAQGLYTAIVAGFVIAFFGGSFHQVSGPTGAFVVIIADIIARQGMTGLHTATLIAGLLLIFMGVSGLGTLVKFIPYPVTIGFTTGIGLIIFAGQIKDLFGMEIAALSPGFFEKIAQYAHNIGSTNPSALGVGLATVILIFVVRRLFPRLPAAVIAVALTTLGAFILKLPAETIGARFGALPRGLPPVSLPALNFQTIRAVFPDALTIALLAAIESLLSAVVADGMTGTRHSASAELNAQGLGNIASVLVGGIPATGAIARTATNIKAGAQSPVSSMVHAAVLLGFALFLGPLVQVIPLATLAGVLVVVAYDMAELPRFFSMTKAPKSDLAVMLATFAITVVVDLTAAVQVGVLLAILLFAKRSRETSSFGPMMASETARDEAGAAGHDSADAESMASGSLPEGCEAYEIEGPFFFGVADLLQDALKSVERPAKAFILMLRRVPAIDATGLNALRSFHRGCKRQGTVLVLCGLRDQPRKALERYGLATELGSENIVQDKAQALKRAAAIIGRA
ncbi:MAG TPA: sulfate permease [Rectinemataceae bacterium]